MQICPYSERNMECMCFSNACCKPDCHLEDVISFFKGTGQEVASEKCSGSCILGMPIKIVQGLSKTLVDCLLERQVDQITCFMCLSKCSYLMTLGLSL